MSFTAFTGVKTFTMAAVLAFSPFHCSDSAAREPSSPGGGNPSTDVTQPNDDLEVPDLGPNAPVPQGGVPEPGTMLIVGSATAGYYAMRRRKQAAIDQVESDGDGSAQV